MKQEDKELLLKDLSARLSYGIILNCCDFIGEKLTEINEDGIINHDYDVDEVKPYLFPLSKMTEEQKRELKDLISRETRILIEQLKIDNYGIDCGKYHFNQVLELEWLLKNHFDYRGLIEKGLAIEVTEDNNPYKS